MKDFRVLEEPGSLFQMRFSFLGKFIPASIEETDMKYQLALFLSAAALLCACAPAATARPAVPVPTSSPTAASTRTPRPSPTPDYPISILTPIPNLSPIAGENAPEIQPLFKLAQEGAGPVFRLAAAGPRQPPWIFSPDLNRMAFVQKDNVKVTDISGTGQYPARQLRMTGNDYPWSDAAFLKDNQLLVLGRGTLSLFDLASGDEIEKIELYCCVDKRIQLLPDGERALIPSRTGLDLYSLDNLERIHGFDAPGNSSMVWDVSPDGRLLAAAGERNPSVFIFDVDRAVVLHTLRVERFTAVNVKFFPDGKQLVLTDELGAFKLLQFWDMETGAKSREIELTGEMLGLPADAPIRVASLAVHPSGAFFVMAISSTAPLLVFWETDAGEPFAIVNTESDGIPSFNYSTKTDILKFIDDTRLLVIDTIWGVAP
jgi:hypothetical protein